MNRKSRIDIAEALSEIEDSVLAEEQSLFGRTSISPIHQEILQILEDHPILVKPTKLWLQDKVAAMEAAKLLALYSIDQIKQLYLENYSEEQWEIFKSKYLRGADV